LDTIRNNNTSVVVISTDDVLSGKQKQSGLNLTMPLNLGFKYNIYRKFNIFAEATYRYTTTDKLDFIDGDATPKTAAAPLGYQGRTSGNDRFFSAKLGISYSFNNIYGIAEYKPKKSIGLFKRFKRK
jgi:opacity protein-like surface antigen